MTHFFSYDSDSGPDSDTDNEENVLEHHDPFRALRVGVDNDDRSRTNPPNLNHENDVHDAWDSAFRLAFISFFAWMVYDAIMEFNSPEALETPSTNFFGL